MNKNCPTVEMSTLRLCLYFRTSN